MSASGRLLLATTEWLRGARSLERLDEIRSTPYRSQSEILADQFQRLSALLAQAAAHVPYYREMFRKLGIQSRDIRSLEDFSALPVLTKDIVRERQRDLIRQDVPQEKLIACNTGGSTGVPLQYYREQALQDISDAGVYRAQLQCGWKTGEMVGLFWGGNKQLYRMSRFEFELRQRIRRKYQFDPFHSGPEEMERWLAKWNQLKPSVAFGYASTIARFAAYMEGEGKQVRPLRGVFVTAEKLYAPQRELMSRVFNCHVYDFYGSGEVRNIAAECPGGSMHVNSDFVILELDRTGAARTEAAPFVVTSLWNTVMPFIRYRNEDCGRLLDGLCDCGNHFPLMELSISRISDNFTLPNGRVVHGEFFTHAMYGSEGISMFQFHQTAPDAIVLWIVPGPGPVQTREESIRSVVEQVRELDPEIKLLVRETDSIPLSNAGKHRFIRSDVRPDAMLKGELAGQSL